MKTRSIESLLVRRRNLSRYIVAFCCGAVLVMAPVITSPQHHHSTGQSAAPSIGSPAVSFELKTLEGKWVALTSFRGKPLVLNFFASWCDPCREEMPLINELAAKGAQHGYNVLGIAVEDNRAALTEYVREAKLAFPIALDLNSTVKRAYRIFGPPATFFVDGQGIIRDVVFGPITPERAGTAIKKVAASPR